ncbi:ribonuclease H-like domain-containing protein [Tanacetum coccineum]
MSTSFISDNDHFQEPDLEYGYGGILLTLTEHSSVSHVASVFDIVHSDLWTSPISSESALLQRIITVLHGEFAMTDLGSLNYFLGISAQRSSSGLFLSQSKFAEEILERAHMQHCNPCALQYLTFTRPDISYAVQQVCLYMHDPRAPHFTALKRILRYVRGTLTFGLQIHASTTAQHLCLLPICDRAGMPCVANVVARDYVDTKLLVELHVPLPQYSRYTVIMLVRVVSTYTIRFQYADIFTKGFDVLLF